MATTSSTTTAQVTCPATVCRCGGTEMVTVRYGHDRRTGRPTATYSACESLKAQGWKGVASVEWLDEERVRSYRHRDGLVTFNW